jgi:sulfhydrogenase subunit alpha
VADYRRVAREFTVEHSHAKHAALASGETYMVGALARLHLWSDRLDGRAREVFNDLFPEGADRNILHNNWAQLVEIVHALETSLGICDALIGMPEVAADTADVRTRAGTGLAAVEVPRGTLYHEYELAEDGTVVAANVITPTAQNLANVERDLRRTAERMLAENAGGDGGIELNLEMVVRAYDPCISCSVHVTRLPA